MKWRKRVKYEELKPGDVIVDISNDKGLRRERFEPAVVDYWGEKGYYDKPKLYYKRGSTTDYFSGTASWYEIEVDAPDDPSLGEACL